MRAPNEPRIPCEMAPMRRLLLLCLLLVLPAGLLLPARLQAQGTQASTPRVQLGLGLGPGTGGFVAYSAPRLTVFTQEAALYADYTPRVVGGSGRLLAAAGLGGSVRALRIAGVVTDFEPGPLDLDLGLRLGPSFYYAFFERTAEEEARSFRIMLDTFARSTLQLGGGRVVFVELGSHAPSLRGGISLGL